MAYLKNHLQTNVPSTVTLVKIGQSKPSSFEPHDLQTYCQFIIGDSGEVFVHYAKAREMETISLFRPSDRLVVERKEGTGEDGKRYYYLQWTAEGDIASGKPQLHSNVQQATQKKHNEDWERKQRVKDVCICLQGFAQAIMTSQGLGFKEAIQEATKAREELIHVSEEIISKE